MGTEPRMLPEGRISSFTGNVLAFCTFCSVILLRCQFVSLEATEKMIKEETPSANVRLLDIDLADLDSVKKAAAEVLAYKEPIHVLFNNAASRFTASRFFIVC